MHKGPSPVQPPRNLRLTHTGSNTDYDMQVSFQGRLWFREEPLEVKWIDVLIEGNKWNSAGWSGSGKKRKNRFIFSAPAIWNLCCLFLITPNQEAYMLKRWNLSTSSCCSCVVCFLRFGWGKIPKYRSVFASGDHNTFVFNPQHALNPGNITQP